MKGLYNPGVLQMEEMMAGRGYDAYEEQTLLLDLRVFKWSVLFIFLLLICVNSKWKYTSYKVSHLTFQARVNSLTWHLW